MLQAIALAVAVQQNATDHAAACETASRSSHSIMVAVNARSEVFLSGKKVPLTALHSDFISLAKRHPHSCVSIMADAKAPYGTVVRVLDAARTAKLDVGFASR